MEIQLRLSGSETSTSTHRTISLAPSFSRLKGTQLIGIMYITSTINCQFFSIFPCRNSPSFYACFPCSPSLVYF